MNKYLSIFLIIICCFLFTGCWSYREIDSLYIISGIGIDKMPNSEQHNITIELVNIKETGSMQQEQKFESALLEIKGHSVFDTIRKIIRISSKRPFLAHATAIIISEEVAREGITFFLDLIAANEEPRLDINVFVSRGQSANEIFSMESLSTEIKSFELSTAVDENEELMRVPTIRAYEIINAIAVPKTGTVIPVITLFNNKDIGMRRLSGGAVFRADKLVGFLEQEDITPYLFIKNKIKTDVLDIHTGEDDPHHIATLETYRSKTKITPVYSDEDVRFDISVNTEVILVELDTMIDYMCPKMRTSLEKMAGEYIEKRITDHINKIKEDFKFDIFGFGNIIRQRNPQLWKKLEDDWDSIFISTDFNVKCNMRIRNTGHTLKPVEAVD